MPMGSKVRRPPPRARPFDLFPFYPPSVHLLQFEVPGMRVQSRRPWAQFMLSVAALAMCASAAQALPVIPGAAGFGMDTPAGRGGKVYRVTNLNADGAGSLKACIDGTTRRVCVFEVSGIIRLTSDLIIRNNYITIAGQTAPSPGIMLRGAALRIHASHVLVQHI